MHTIGTLRFDRTQQCNAIMRVGLAIEYIDSITEGITLVGLTVESEAIVRSH